MSFPTLERCDHGEYRDRYCIKCDLDIKSKEIERLTLELAKTIRSRDIARQVLINAIERKNDLARELTEAHVTIDQLIHD